MSIALRGTGGTGASSSAAAAGTAGAGPPKPLISWDTTRRSESRREVEDRRCLAPAADEVRGTHCSEKSAGARGRAAGTAAPAAPAPAAAAEGGEDEAEQGAAEGGPSAVL